MNNNYPLHFAHANGFPASSYSAMFSYFSRQIEVFALEKFAHNPRFPVSENWHIQVQELIEHIESSEHKKVFAVGHSFGAVISYMAACTRPDLFRGLIMLDPPFVTGVTRVMVKLLKHIKLLDAVTPANQASTRCTTWPADTNLVEYFKQKGLFKNMHPQCIQDYVDAAIDKKEQGYKLNFDHQVEANLFRTVPLNIHQYYGKLSVPSLLVTGENTTVCLPHRIKPFLKGNNSHHKIIAKGGHMFPLEQPELVADTISKQIMVWQSAGI